MCMQIFAEPCKHPKPKAVITMGKEPPAIKMCQEEVVRDQKQRMPRPIPSGCRLLSKDCLRSKVSSVLSLMLAGGLCTRSFSYWLSGTSKKKQQYQIYYLHY
ncbi:hypothetical protein RRG08_034872 [Elysia crispata]|uniref:Uncharacterized protein n=1 Tax=Elysia crispata TaxID=231223 RepID=A0AAE1AM37_9GAST|nr:hypothetical protein RRG08_034872 [Elysia crispata]